MQRLDERLTHLKSLTAAMGGCVEQMLKESGTITFDTEAEKIQLFSLILQREKEIDELQVKLGRSCFRILARQRPVARDLRLILSIISTNTALERIGDLSLNIAKKGKDLKEDPLLEISLDNLKEMFHEITVMVQSCLDAFINEDEDLSRKVIKQDAYVDQLKDGIYIKLKECILVNRDLVDTCIQLVSISEKLERIGDQASNIAEEVIFLETGRDVKHSKI